MGVRQIYFEYLDKLGVFDSKPCRILDIGAQNCYLFTPEYIVDFLDRRGVDGAAHASAAASFAAGGAFSAEVNGFNNNAFLNELCRLAEIKYQSIDVFDRPDNIVADLNEFRVPSALKEAFTAVLNFGTTEHVLDQRNCFEVIHDCAAVGGYMFHQVPSVGCVDHSFFLYSPIFFAKMAEANNYEMIDIWFSGPYGANCVYKTMTSEIYDKMDKGRASLIDQSLPDNQPNGWETTLIPDGTINVMFRKTSASAFRLPLELSTAVGKSALATHSETGLEHVIDLKNIPSAILLEELAKRLVEPS